MSFNCEFHSYWRKGLPSPEVIVFATRIMPEFEHAVEAEFIWLERYGHQMKVVGFFDERSNFTRFHGEFEKTAYRRGFEHIKAKFNYEGAEKQKHSRSETNVDGPILGVKKGADSPYGREVYTAFDRRVENITEEEAHAICRRIHTMNQNMNIDQFMDMHRHIIAPGDVDRETQPPLTTHPTVDNDSDSAYSSSIPNPSLRSYSVVDPSSTMASSTSRTTNPWA